MKKSKDKKYEKYFMAITPTHKNYLKDIGMEGVREGNEFILRLDKISPNTEGESTYYFTLDLLRIYDSV